MENRYSKRSDTSGRQTGLEDARQTFEKANLQLPPIPERFVPDLRTIQPWCFATREVDRTTMYFFDEYLQEALAGKTPDYLAVSHGGHGFNSYSLNYQLVDGSLVLMAQALWGGIYMEEPETSARVAALFDRCAALIAAMERAKSQGLMTARPGRLVVFESDFRRPCRWGWLDRTLDAEAASDWIHDRGKEDERSLAEDELPTKRGAALAR